GRGHVLRSAWRGNKPVQVACHRVPHLQHSKEFVLHVMKKYGLVFYVSLAVSLLFLGFGAVFPKKLEYFSNTFLSFIYDKLGWLFLLTVFILLVFCVFIAFSRFGKVKLGQDSDVPEYNRVTWIAMLFRERKEGVAGWEWN